MKLTKASRKVKEVADEQVVGRLAHGRDNAFNRFPLLFTMLTTFGVVTVLYGFEHLIDRISFLADRPIISLLTGLAILAVTGSLYKKL